MGGIREMNDAQRDALYSKEATDAFGMTTPPDRVYTQKKDRRKHKTIKPATLLAEKLPQKSPSSTGQQPQKSRPSAKVIVSDTVSTCLQACTGAVYDFWNWQSLPGNAPTKMHTIVTRGGRGPYLLLTFVTILVGMFCMFVLIRQISKNNNNKITPYINPTIGPPSSGMNTLPNQFVQTMVRRTAIPPSGKALLGNSGKIGDISRLRLAPTATYHYA